MIIKERRDPGSSEPHSSSFAPAAPVWAFALLSHIVHMEESRRGRQEDVYNSVCTHILQRNTAGGSVAGSMDKQGKQP